MARSTARKRALNTLYEADEKGQDIESLLAERLAQPGAQTPLPDYAVRIVHGVAEHRDDIDRALDEYSTKWSVRRMAVVDRNILRIAVWEMLFGDDVPDKVAIDEALGLAKTLSDDDSPSFIHGLLSAVSDHKDEVFAAIAEERRRREQAEAEKRRLASPTAPGFLVSGGVSGHGDGKGMDDESDAAVSGDQAGAESDTSGQAENVETVAGDTDEANDDGNAGTSNDATDVNDADGAEEADKSATNVARTSVAENGSEASGATEAEDPAHKGRLIVLTGPTAVGKGTVEAALLERHPEIWVSVSGTTRDPRPGEVNGKNYWFMSEDEFVEREKRGWFLETAVVHGMARYGTPLQPVLDHLARNIPTILEIDLQGARRVKQRAAELNLEIVSVFIAPPSYDELVKRLVGRGTENEEQRAKRLETAKVELAAEPEFDVKIVNDKVDQAANDLWQVIAKEYGIAD